MDWPTIFICGMTLIGSKFYLLKLISHHFNLHTTYRANSLFVLARLSQKAKMFAQPLITLVALRFVIQLFARNRLLNFTCNLMSQIELRESKPRYLPSLLDMAARFKNGVHAQVIFQTSWLINTCRVYSTLNFIWNPLEVFVKFCQHTSTGDILRWCCDSELFYCWQPVLEPTIEHFRSNLYSSLIDGAYKSGH